MSDLIDGWLHVGLPIPATPDTASIRAIRAACRRHAVIHYGGSARRARNHGAGRTTMRDPRDLYAFESAEVVAAVPRRGLTLVHALPGIVDAGESCRIAAAYLRDSLRNVRLVTFDADELLDYRGSRPQAVFDGASFRSVELPEMALYLVYDESDRPFLLLDGPEPDLQWRRLAQAITDLVEYFDVESVVSMNAVPMAVPHTRPIGLIAHANRQARERDGIAAGDDETEIIVPASFGAPLERELERAGHPAQGFAAQIPHYLTRSDFPAGALALFASRQRRHGPWYAAGDPRRPHRRRRERSGGHARRQRRGAGDRVRPRAELRRHAGRRGSRSRDDDGHAHGG